MESGIISLRYARAIYEHAFEKKSEVDVYNDMQQLLSSFKAYPELRRLMNNPILPLSKKIHVLNAACGITTGEITKDVIELIVNNKRGDYMENIARTYIETYRKEKGIKASRLITTTPITEKTQKELEKIILKHVECECVEFETSVDPNIIGGFILEVDDLLLNASVKKQLTQLKLDLME